MKNLTKDQLIQNAEVSGLAEHMAKVESHLQEQVAASEHFSSIISRAVAEGKRLRPIILILVAMLNGKPPKDSTYEAATAIELLHQASLMHDKIIDAETEEAEAQMILAGDYLIAASFKTAPNQTVVRTLSDCITKMADGQAMQLSSAYDSNLSDKTYFDTVRHKTVPLFLAAGKIGADLGGLNAEQAKAASSFTENFGIAFQLIDDLIDHHFSDKEIKPASSAIEGYVQESVRPLKPLPASQAKFGLVNISTCYRDWALSGNP